MSLIKGLLKQTCVIYSYLHEGAGEKVYGEAEERKCRLETGNHLRATLLGTDGTILETAARARLFTEGEPCRPQSRIVVEGREYVVLECQEMHGMTRHLEWYLA